MKKIGYQSCKSQRGFTLLEVLVTMVVLSLGLLGYAGLQMASLKNSASAYQRSQATILAYDIIDRLRANRAQAIGGGYNIAIGAAGAGAGVAGLDLVDWKVLVGNALPGGDAAINVDGTGNVLIQIQWMDKRDRSANQNANSTFRTQTVI